jgi:hypothetical protein
VNDRHAEGREHIVRLARQRVPIGIGMFELIATGSVAMPSAAWDAARAIDYQQDAAPLEAWLRGVLTSDAPPADIQTLWFDLHEELGAARGFACTFLGTTEQGPPNPAEGILFWSPEHGRAPSRVLALLGAALTADDEATRLARYVLPLAFAVLTLTPIFARLGPTLVLGAREHRFLAVGYDSDDYLLLEPF